MGQTRQREPVSKTLRLGLTGALVAMLLAGAPAAGANDGDIIRQGSCSGATDWKLKLSPENGCIEVEFEVDQNKVGRRWTVALKRNGVRFFKRPQGDAWPERIVRPTPCGQERARPGPIRRQGPQLAQRRGVQGVGDLLGFRFLRSNGRRPQPGGLRLVRG
jgi:hypothetical protein